MQILVPDGDADLIDMKKDEFENQKARKIQVRPFLFSGFLASKFFLML